MTTKSKLALDQYFLTNSPVSLHNYHAAMDAAQTVIIEKFAILEQAYSGKSIAALQSELKASSEFMEAQSLPDVIEHIGEQIVENLINVNHPHCIAHLHCPPLIASIAAEVIISATNQSMDSWDQSAAATLVEQYVVDWFCKQYSLGKQADGVFTSGGTQSNFMGLLLARDYAAQQHFNWSISELGLPPKANKFRIICSQDSHFSIRQTARLLGLGDQAVVSLPLDEHHHLLPSVVRQCFKTLTDEGLLPIALVSTAGTTDFGTISPLEALGVCAQELGLWFHVDAAVGGALMFSEQHRYRLAGIELVDSLSLYDPASLR
jgi:L-2,4-diaminobutyrate decarboxylase